MAFPGREYSGGNRYSYSGWYDGGEECDPPEPGKEWISIEDSMEEMAVIVLRTDASIFEDNPEELERIRKSKEKDAETIVAALNYWYNNYKE